jgi:hypothetical protein
MNMRYETDDLFDALCEVLSQHWVKGPGDTPDFILASYLISCLSAYRDTTKARDQWFGLKPPNKFESDEQRAEWEATKTHCVGNKEGKKDA